MKKSEEYKQKLIDDFENGEVFSKLDLSLRLDNIILFARIEGSQEATKELFKPEVIGEHITEPLYKCVSYGDFWTKDGITLGNLYQVLPDGSFYDDDGDLRIEMGPIFLDMKNPIYPSTEGEQK